MKLGFIGCGNMAQAMIKGILDKGLYKAEDMMASDAFEATREKVKIEFEIHTTADNYSVAEKSDIIILAIKPINFAQAISCIEDAVTDKKLIISIGAGQTIDRMQELFKKKVKLIRTMPNTPAFVGEGTTGISYNKLVTEDELQKAIEIFESFGIAQVLSEKLMDTVVGVSGSAPAYVFLLIEAMSDAAVADGMPREQAYKFAAQTVMGSAKMVLETGKHPGELKNMVCSPGGTTMEAVCILEKMGFRSSVIEAQRACVKKSKSL